MDALPESFAALCLLAFTLGARHGFDADHLATIDGLTRCNAERHPALARACGALFSGGHGLVVCAFAVLTATAWRGWQAPAWLEATGVAVSIAFLFGLAVVNLRAVMASEPGAPVAPRGLRSRLLGRVLTVRQPWAVAAVGALFAISFDTLSQAAVFALAATHHGGLPQVLLVCGLFVLGMLVVDGANGLWIHRLVRHASGTAAIASRVMALAVAAVSLALGIFTLAKVLSADVEAWAEARGMVIGAAVMISVAVAFAVGMVAARRERSVLVPASARP